ncbi:MAG: phage tail assembly protein [Hyphomicrobium sp.]
MAKKTTPAAGTAGNSLQHSFTLQRAIPGANGDPVHELTVVEPELHHFIKAGRKSTLTEQTITLLAQLSGLPEDSIKRLKTPDARRIQTWLSSLRDLSVARSSARGDGDSRTFDLSVPLVDGAQIIGSLTLREPDLESAIAIERFKTEPEQTAAMIAALSGHVIPLISRLKVRDVGAIEEWLVPFVRELGSTEDEPGEA